MSKGRLITTHPISTSKRKIAVPIRLNVHTGVFSAELDGIVFQSDKLLSLRHSLTRAARMVDGDALEPVGIDGSEFSNVIDISDGEDKNEW